MKRFLYELSESWKIAVAQMRSNMTRSTLTALGVIIGIVAVTLMGTAIGGIQVGFDKSMAIFGDDVLYVGQWPWKNVDDWWNYRDRDRKSTRLNSSHGYISYAVFCLKKKKKSSYGSIKIECQHKYYG